MIGKLIVIRQMATPIFMALVVANAIGNGRHPRSLLVSRSIIGNLLGPNETVRIVKHNYFGLNMPLVGFGEMRSRLLSYRAYTKCLTCTFQAAHTFIPGRRTACS